MGFACAAAAFIVGNLGGFLFGLPRTLERAEPDPQARAMSFVQVESYHQARQDYDVAAADYNQARDEYSQLSEADPDNPELVKRYEDLAAKRKHAEELLERLREHRLALAAAGDQALTLAP